MTSDQAIKILQEQIDSLKWINKSTEDTWITQTKSEVEKIFGITSSEYSFLIFFKFEEESKGMGMSLISNNTHTVKARDFLERCIQTLKRRKSISETKPVVQYVDRPVIKEVIKEVVKQVVVYPPKVNAFKTAIRWIKRKDSIGFITFILFIAGLIFGAGWYFGERKADIKNVELRTDNRQLTKDTASLGNEIRKLTTLSSDTPKKKAANEKESNQKKESPDTTHR